MIECVPPSDDFLKKQLAGASDNEADLLALANIFGQISTNLSRALQVYSERVGMSTLEGQALFVVAELGNDARPGTIADRLKMPLSTMTGVANRLTASGLVERRPAPEDGRSAILVITPDGMERMQQLFKPVIRDVAEILESYGADAVNQISEGLQIVLSLTETLEARVKDESLRG